MAASHPDDGYDISETDDAVRAIVNIICKKHGCKISLIELKNAIRRQRLQLSQNISTLIDDHSNNFHVTDSIVTACTTLEICPTHCIKQGACTDHNCDKLHICKFFLLSTCRFATSSGVACQFGHDLKSNHNKALLREHLLDTLNPQEFQSLFLNGTRRNATTVPLVCRYYNKLSGCSKRNTCPHLHICEFYIQGSCKFAAACKRNHDITPSIKKILTKFGINASSRPRDILHELRIATPISNPSLRTMTRFTSMPMLFRPTGVAFSLPRSVFKPAFQHRASEGSGDAHEDHSSLQICMYNLRSSSGCWFRENCTGHHTARRYLWQHVRGSDADWTDFEYFLNDKLEEGYRRVECDSCNVSIDEFGNDDSDSDEEASEITVDFTKMEGQCQGKQLLVRRLSTASSATLNPRVARSFHDHVTRWCWFWYNDIQQEWTEYGHTGEDDQRPDIDSDEIEASFASDPTGNIKFQAGEYSYRLSFPTMIQKNSQTRTKKRVRRRPVL